MGHRSANPADLQRLSAGSAGVALPRPVPPRASRLDYRRLGRVGEQPPSEVLFADQGRPQAARDRGRKVGATLGRRQPRVEENLAVRAWHILRDRFRSLFFRAGRESDLNEELHLHLERDIERLQARGLSRKEARLEAMRQFGGVEQIKEASRDARGTAVLDALARDTRYGLRRLVRDWPFTTAGVLILGLGIGANTAIFSLVNAALFRPQAFAHPERLVNIYQNDRAGKPLVVASYAAYLEMAEYKDIFAATMAASIPNAFRYLHDGAIRNAAVEYATSTYLDVLGLRPSLGRWFDQTEERRGAPLVGVLGHQTWT